MASVSVAIAGRSYSLACRDGDEARVQLLAGDIAARAEALTRTLGTMSEARLLLMSALMIADELHDLRASQAAPRTADQDDRIAAMAEREDRIAALAERAEALVAGLAAGDSRGG